MKKLTLLKSLLLAIGLLAGNVGAWAQTCNISDDFATLTASTSYASVTTTAGWKGTNTAVLQGGTTNSNQTFTFIGSDATTKALCINGKTTAVGVITSPTLTGGCSSISFKYGHPFAETNGAKFTIEIKQNGTTVWSEQVVNTSMTITTAYTYSKTGLSISGDFTVVITNNSPSASTSNKDRVAIWGICISNYSPSTPQAATPTFSPEGGTFTSAQNVTISCATSGATIYYTTDGSTPDNTKTQYTGAIYVTATTTLKAIAYASGYDPSAVASATYTINAAPTITVTEVTVPNYTTTAGNTQAQTITVNATNLTADITVAITGTDAGQFTVSPATIPQTGGTVSNATVTVTYAPNTPGSHTATVELSSNGATTVTRSLTGTATLTAPVANNATGVSKTGFTANWNAVTGATSYDVNVYTKTTGTITATDLFISEYGEGSGGNKKYVEIFNGTGTDVDLSNYVIKKAVNGANWNTTVYSFPASTVLTNGSTFVLANNSTDVIGATVYDGFCTWNGDDAIGLFKNDVLIDIFGVPDVDPGTGWSVAGITDATVDHILIRKPSVSSPTTDWTASAGTTTDDSQWIVSDFVYNATNQTTNLGSHTMDGAGTINPITGSPFTVSAPATTQAVTGLSNLNTYYYTVTAKNGTYSSPVSNETTVGLLSRVANPNEQLNLWSVGNKVYFRAAAGEAVELFNIAGQKIVSRIATEGLNEITVSGKGIVFVKAGSLTGKVLIH